MSSKVYVKLIYTCMFEVHITFKTQIIQNHKTACFVSYTSIIDQRNVSEYRYLKKYL